jgi:hypothetical protein
MTIYTKENSETKRLNAALEERKTHRHKRTDNIEMSEKPQTIEKNVTEQR